MRTSSDHILTSHAGSLPRPDALIEANRAREASEAAGMFQDDAEEAIAIVGIIDRAGQKSFREALNGG